MLGATRVANTTQRSRSGKKQRSRNRKLTKGSYGFAFTERQKENNTTPTAGQVCQQTEMSSIHNLARKTSFKMLSKQRSDGTAYFPFRRSSQDGPEKADDAYTTKETVKATQYSQNQRSLKSPVSSDLKTSSPKQGIERLTKLKRSVLQGPQPNLLTNELRKYLMNKPTPGKKSNRRSSSKCSAKHSRSRSRSRSRSASKKVVANWQRERKVFNNDLPKTPTTAVHSSMMNGSYCNGNKNGDIRTAKKSRSKSRRRRMLQQQLKTQYNPNQIFMTKKPKRKSRCTIPRYRTVSRNAARQPSHSRSVSKVSVRSDNCYHTSTRCLSINFPNRSDQMGRRVSAWQAGSGHATMNGMAGPARIEQVLVSPPEHSLEWNRSQGAMNRSKNSSYLTARGFIRTNEKSKQKSKSKSKSQRRIRQGKIVGAQVPLRRRAGRALSTTFGTRQEKKIITQQQNFHDQADQTNSFSRVQGAQNLSVANPKRKAKSRRPGSVTQWMKFMTRGSLKKSNQEIKMRKLVKANKKSRSRSKKQRSMSKKKRRSEKLERARQNIKARMFEQQQQKKATGNEQQEPVPLYAQGNPQVLMGQIPEPVWTGVDHRGQHDGLFRDIVDDYNYNPQTQNTPVYHLGNSLGGEGVVHHRIQHSTSAPRLGTDSSQRTLSVENYQISEERTFRPSRQPNQTSNSMNHYFKNSDKAYREFIKSRVPCSGTSTICNSERYDNYQQQALPPNYNEQQQQFYTQQANSSHKLNQHSDPQMMGLMKDSKVMMSSASLGKHGSRSLSNSKRKTSARPSSASLNCHATRSRNALSRSQTGRSRRQDQSSAHGKGRKQSRNSAMKKSRSQSYPSRSRSLRQSCSNCRLKSRQASRHAVPLYSAHSPKSSSIIQMQQHPAKYEQIYTRSSQPANRTSDYLRAKGGQYGQPQRHGSSGNYLYPAHFAGNQTFFAHSDCNQDDAAFNPMSSQTPYLQQSHQSLQAHRAPYQIPQENTMNSSKNELHQSGGGGVFHHQKLLNQTERREKRLQMEGADKPLLDDKAAREELRELNFRQENRLAVLKESLKQNLQDIKETQKQLRVGGQAQEEANSETESKQVARRKAPKTFAEQVNRFTDRVDAMIEERYEREVTKIKDRRLKLQILKNRAEREGAQHLLSDPAETPTRSGEDTVASERERRSNIDELIRQKQEQIENLQKQKLLKRLSEQVENELQNFDAAKLERMSVACSAVDLQNPEATQSLMTTGARPRHTQSNVQFSAVNARSSARRSHGSARRSARKSARKIDQCSDTRSGRSARKSRTKQRKALASRTGSIDSGKVSLKSAKRKRSLRRKSRNSGCRRTPSKASSKSRLRGHEKLLLKRGSRLRSGSQTPTRNLHPYKTEVLNSKNSTIVHQCKASAGSGRPTPELGPEDPYSVEFSRGARQGLHDSAQNTQPPGILQDAKRLRFSMDRGTEDNTATVNGIEVVSARGSAFASARSGMPFNIQTAQGMNGSGSTGPGMIYNNLIKINKDSGIFENFGSCSLTVDNAPVPFKDSSSRPKGYQNSILKNMSAKLGNSQASFDRSGSQEEINSNVGSFASQRAGGGIIPGSHEYGGNVKLPDSQPQKRTARDRQARRKGGKAANPSGIEKLRGAALSDSEDSDSDSDLEFRLGKSAAFIEKVQRAVSGHQKLAGSSLPKWQRLAVNQIRV